MKNLYWKRIYMKMNDGQEPILNWDPQLVYCPEPPTDTKEEIEAAVRQGNKELNANLTEDQINQIIDVMVKIKDMGIDFNILAEQADKIYAKYGDQIKAGTFKLEDVDWNDLGIGKVISNAVGNFFKSVGTSVKPFFGSFKK